MLFLSDGWGVFQDGYDCLDWVVAQRWCNGRIGMVGASAPGMTQYFAAGALHPNLECIAPILAGPSIYHHVAYNNGCFRKVLVENWLSGVGALHLADTVAAHPDYDSMWSVVNLAEKWDSVNVPAFHLSGWYDMYTDGQIEAFCEMQARFGNQRLLIGPWGHGSAFGSRNQGDLVYPSNVEFSDDDIILMAIGWYNYWLNDDTLGPVEPPILYYLTGDCDIADTTHWNRWIPAYDWPPPEMEYKSYYIGDSGVLDTLLPTGDGVDTIVYDPADPCPTIGGREYIGLTTGYGPKDQRVMESRSDVLVYQTAPLPEPMEVVGKLWFILYGASNRIDTDFAVRITDIYPDGRSILMTDNIIMARHRHGLTTEDFLVPGQPDTFEIDLWSIAHVFNAGHRIGVLISSSNYPRFEKNPNTGATFMRDDPTMLVATNTVFRSSDMASKLLLPVVPWNPHFICEGTAIPDKIKLCSFPNPFNSSVLLSIELENNKYSGSNEFSGPIQLSLFDMAGRLVRDMLIESMVENGRAEVSWVPAGDVSTGVYLLRAEYDGKTYSTNIVYIK